MPERQEYDLDEVTDPVPATSDAQQRLEDPTVTAAQASTAVQGGVLSRLKDADWVHAGAVSGDSGAGEVEAAMRKAQRGVVR